MLEKLADVPFGAASVWKIIARKPITKAQAFELNLVGFLVLAFAVELVIMGSIAKANIIKVAPQHFVIVAVVIVFSLVLTSFRKE